MSQYHPNSKFKWLNKKESNRFDVYSVAENSSISYVLEVDLEYPSELHKLHNDYPLASETIEISQNLQ